MFLFIRVIGILGPTLFFLSYHISISVPWEWFNFIIYCITTFLSHVSGHRGLSLRNIWSSTLMFQHDKWLLVLNRDVLLIFKLTFIRPFRPDNTCQFDVLSIFKIAVALCWIDVSYPLRRWCYSSIRCKHRFGRYSAIGTFSCRSKVWSCHSWWWYGLIFFFVIIDNLKRCWCYAHDTLTIQKGVIYF